MEPREIIAWTSGESAVYRTRSFEEREWVSKAAVGQEIITIVVVVSIIFIIKTLFYPQSMHLSSSPCDGFHLFYTSEKVNSNAWSIIVIRNYESFTLSISMKSSWGWTHSCKKRGWITSGIFTDQPAFDINANSKRTYALLGYYHGPIYKPNLLVIQSFCPTWVRETENTKKGNLWDYKEKIEKLVINLHTMNCMLFRWIINSKARLTSI